MIDAATIEKEALNLSHAQRDRLASVLFRSLDESDDSLSPAEWEQLWAEECVRRDKEMDDDPSMTIPGEVVIERLRQRAEGRR